MLEITAEMVKELRERSGVGMSKCKEALVEAQGDMQKAIDILRKKGLASAVKKEGRETKEGSISFFENSKNIAVLEVNTETDFVVKNEKFQKYIKELAEQACKTNPKSLDSFAKDAWSIDPSLSVDEYRNLIIQSIGENIQISRMDMITKRSNASYGIYSHMAGKIVTIVEIQGSATQEKLAYDIAMHVAAENPEYLKSDEIPEQVIRKEEEIARSQIKNKPENVIEKIIQGKIKAYTDQVCLVNQKFVKDPSKTVEQYVEEKAKEISASLILSCFWRWQIGESK